MSRSGVNIIEVHNIINEIIVFYHQLRIWKLEETTIYNQWGRNSLHLFISVSFGTSLVSGAFQSDHWNDRIVLAAIAISILVNTVKLTYILWKKDEILTLLNDVAVHCFADRREFIQISKKLKKFINFAYLFLAMLLVQIVVVGILGLPIYSSEKSLPFCIGFPLDYQNSEIGYCMAYAYYLMIAGTFTVIYTLISILIWYIMFNCSIKYQILGTQFSRLGSSRKSEQTENQLTTTAKITKKPLAETQNLFQEELIELIKTHQNLQETIDRFKLCFAKLFFVQISTSAICICISIYILALETRIWSSPEIIIQLAIYVVILMYNIFDIFMIVNFGNEIKLFSGRLPYCLFESEWMNQSKSCKKTILVLMERLKQPQEIVIGKLYPLNLDTFTLILDSAYRVFNILKSFK